MNMPSVFIPPPMADEVDMAGAWDEIWSAFTGAFDSDITTLLTVIGAILMIGAIIGFFWEKRRGGGGMGGQGNSKLMWVLAVGALFAAPQVILPFLLTIADSVANFVLGFMD